MGIGHNIGRNLGYFSPLRKKNYDLYRDFDSKVKL